MQKFSFRLLLQVICNCKGACARKKGPGFCMCKAANKNCSTRCRCPHSKCKNKVSENHCSQSLLSSFILEKFKALSRSTLRCVFPRHVRIPKKTDKKPLIPMEKYSLQEKFNHLRLKSRCVQAYKIHFTNCIRNMLQ